MAATEREIRSAAEMLLGSSSSSNQHSGVNIMPSRIGSVNSPDYVLSDDVFTGLRQSGRMSVVRRFFCLFVTFDLIFTSFLWFICIMLSGGDIFEVLKSQILHYNIHMSLFDIVMSAIVRFTVLLLFYGLLYIDHWCVIALSTAGTCAFLIAKVFMYNWAGATQPVFEVILVLSVFVLSWGEAWFLDFRVIPQETQAQHFVQGYSEDERAPLLRQYLQRLPRYDDNTESIANFYSPLDSPLGSDDEDGRSRRSNYPVSRNNGPAFVIKNPANIVNKLDLPYLYLTR